MKTAWIGSLLFHATLAGGLLWFAVDHPPRSESGSINAVTVALVDAPAGSHGTITSSLTVSTASPVTPANAELPVEPDRAVPLPPQATPIQPVLSDPAIGASPSEPTDAAPVLMATTASPAPARSTTTEAVGVGPTGAMEPTAAGSVAAAPAGGDGSTAHSPAGGAVGGPADPWPAYFASVRAAVERAKHYPFSARLAGLEDRVTVAFSITADGATERIHVTGPSRFPVLNDAAVETIRRAARFPAPPLRDSRSGLPAGQAGVRVTVPLEFSLHTHQEAQPE